MYCRRIRTSHATVRNMPMQMHFPELTLKRNNNMDIALDHGRTTRHPSYARENWTPHTIYRINVSSIQKRLQHQKRRNICKWQNETHNMNGILKFCRQYLPCIGGKRTRQAQNGKYHFIKSHAFHLQIDIRSNILDRKNANITKVDIPNNTGFLTSVHCT